MYMYKAVNHRTRTRENREKQKTEEVQKESWQFQERIFLTIIRVPLPTYLHSDSLYGGRLEVSSFVRVLLESVPEGASGS